MKANFRCEYSIDDSIGIEIFFMNKKLDELVSDDSISSLFSLTIFSNDRIFSLHQQNIPRHFPFFFFQQARDKILSKLPAYLKALSVHSSKQNNDSCFRLAYELYRITIMALIFVQFAKYTNKNLIFLQSPSVLGISLIEISLFVHKNILNLILRKIIQLATCKMPNCAHKLVFVCAKEREQSRASIAYSSISESKMYF